jgi:hypothetical protein
MWVDSDAVVHDVTKSFTTFFSENPASFFIGASDPPCWPSPFMAGVFMIKTRGERAVLLMDAWLAGFSKSKWLVKLIDISSEARNSKN